MLSHSTHQDGLCHNQQRRGGRNMTELTLESSFGLRVDNLPDCPKCQGETAAVSRLYLNHAKKEHHYVFQLHCTQCKTYWELYDDRETCLALDPDGDKPPFTPDTLADNFRFALSQIMSTGLPLDKNTTLHIPPKEEQKKPTR